MHLGWWPREVRAVPVHRQEPFAGDSILLLGRRVGEEREVGVTVRTGRPVALRKDLKTMV
jgi:hypothetical protein